MLFTVIFEPVHEHLFVYETLRVMIEDYRKEDADVHALAASSRSMYERVTRDPRHGAFRCLLGLHTGRENAGITQFERRGCRGKLIALAEKALQKVYPGFEFSEWQRDVLQNFGNVCSVVNAPFGGGKTRLILALCIWSLLGEEHATTSNQVLFVTQETHAMLEDFTTALLSAVGKPEGILGLEYDPSTGIDHAQKFFEDAADPGITVSEERLAESD